MCEPSYNKWDSALQIDFAMWQNNLPLLEPDCAWEGFIDLHYKPTSEQKQQLEQLGVYFWPIMKEDIPLLYTFESDPKRCVELSHHPVVKYMRCSRQMHLYGVNHV